MDDVLRDIDEMSLSHMSVASKEKDGWKEGIGQPHGEDEKTANLVSEKSDGLGSGENEFERELFAHDAGKTGTEKGVSNVEESDRMYDSHV